MKLATYKDGSRDGQLIVVSRDLRSAHYATGIASRMQQVLDDWGFMAPQLQDLYHLLNTGRAAHAFAFDPQLCMAPLPRSYQVLEAQAYPSHLQRLQPEVAVSTTEARMRQAAGDHLCGACEEVVVPSAALDVDLGAGIAAITGDVPVGTTAEAAMYSVRLLMLCNSLSLRQLQRSGDGRPFDGANVQAWPAMVCSPVAVTVDGVADVWHGGRLQLALHTACNGRKIGISDTHEGMAFHFGQLIAQVARTRGLRAGSVVSAGVVSAPEPSEQPKKSATAAASGDSRSVHCIAEKRVIEVAQQGAASTPYLQFGDTVRIEAKSKDGQSVFGAIDHALVSPQGDGSAA